MRPKTRPADPEFMVTAADIAKALGTTPRTLYVWYERFGFPLATLPDGRRFTTRTLVSAWALSRVVPPEQRKRKPGYRGWRKLAGAARDLPQQPQAPDAKL